MRLEDLHTASKEELENEFKKVAATTVMSVGSLQEELQRRATLELTEATERITVQALEIAKATDRLSVATGQVRDSSHRLEKLTKWLLVLTIFLLIAAFPPAYEILAHFFASHG